MEFTQKDELGLKRTYFVVTKFEHNNQEYLIYSDLIKNDTDEFRLLVGMIENGIVNRVEKEIETAVIEKFKIVEKDYIKYIKEMI